MTTLRNPKHERLAQELANGTNQSFAYIAAGFQCNPRAARASVSRLLAHVVHGAAIRGRVDEILTEREAERSRVAAQAEATAIDHVAISKEWILAKLAGIATACSELQDVYSATGILIGKRPVNAGGANRALELLGKQAGMFRDALDVATSPDADLDRMTPEEQDREAQRLATALGVGRKSGGLAG